jgi:hypothetical protein
MGNTDDTPTILGNIQYHCAINLPAFRLGCFQKPTLIKRNVYTLTVAESDYGRGKETY